MTDVPTIQVDLPMDKIAEFCRRWQITEFALFGSVLRDDFRPDSDVDVLVTFASEAKWSLLDVVGMREELMVLFGRPVDFMDRPSIEQSYNYIRRNSILNSARAIYVA